MIAERYLKSCHSAVQLQITIPLISIWRNYKLFWNFRETTRKY